MSEWSPPLPTEAEREAWRDVFWRAAEQHRETPGDVDGIVRMVCRSWTLPDGVTDGRELEARYVHHLRCLASVGAGVVASLLAQVQPDAGPDHLTAAEGVSVEDPRHRCVVLAVEGARRQAPRAVALATLTVLHREGMAGVAAMVVELARHAAHLLDDLVAREADALAGTGGSAA